MLDTNLWGLKSLIPPLNLKLFENKLFSGRPSMTQVVAAYPISNAPTPVEVDVFPHGENTHRVACASTRETR